MSQEPRSVQDRLSDPIAKHCPAEKDLAGSWGAAINLVPGLGQGSDNEACQGWKNGVSVLLIRAQLRGRMWRRLPQPAWWTAGLWTGSIPLDLTLGWWLHAQA